MRYVMLAFCLDASLGVIRCARYQAPAGPLAPRRLWSLRTSSPRVSCKSCPSNRSRHARTTLCTAVVLADARAARQRSRSLPSSRLAASRPSGRTLTSPTTAPITRAKSTQRPHSPRQSSSTRRCPPTRCVRVFVLACARGRVRCDSVLLRSSFLRAQAAPFMDALANIGPIAITVDASEWFKYEVRTDWKYIHILLFYF